MRRTPPPEHGTPAGYRRHRASTGEDPDWPVEACEACKAAAAARKKLVRSGGVARRQPARHGTRSGYRRHLNSDGSDRSWPRRPCDACAEANAAAERERRAGRPTTISTPLPVEPPPEPDDDGRDPFYPIIIDA